jgi:hypothetical protein
MSHQAPSIFATVTVNLTCEEHAELVAAAARSGKSQRRFVKDAMRALCGMPPSVPCRGRRTDLLLKKKEAASNQLAAREVPLERGTYGESTQPGES